MSIYSILFFYPLVLAQGATLELRPFTSWGTKERHRLFAATQTGGNSGGKDEEKKIGKYW